MRNHNTLRIFLPLAIAGVSVSFILPSASAQQPDGPGQGGPRPGGQGGGPGGQRPGGPGGQGGPGMPSGFVPGDYLGQYLGLTGAQQQKLANLMKTMDALGRENFAPTAFAQLQLTEDEMRKIAAGSKPADVLTAEQQQTLNANKRPARRGGPGGPGGFGGPGGQGGPGQGGPGQGGGVGGPDGNPPPPPLGGTSRAVEAPAPNALGALAPGVTRVPVVFSGGHETDPRDHGRPVILVASALGVTSEIFRDAFSHVHPAGPGSGGPDAAQAQQNKAALMNALGKYGIDNDRLDAVSNYYRYPPGSASLWNNRPAVANALVKNGVVIGFEVVQGGAGYTSTPTVSVPNVHTGPVSVKLAFGKNFATNGSIAEIAPASN